MPQSNQTEQATPRRRQKAREKGQVARSRDLIGAAAGVAATLVLFTQMSSFPQLWRSFLRDCLEGAVSGRLRMDALPPFLTHSGLFAGDRRRARAWLDRGSFIGRRAGRARFCSCVAAAHAFPLIARRAAAPAVFRQRLAFPSEVIASRRGGRLHCLSLPAPRLVLAGCSFRRAMRTAWPPSLQSRVFEMAWKSALVLLLWSFLDFLFERRHLESELK